MPIYEYRCERGHTFEVLQRMSEDALETCEVCDAPATRVMHAPAVHFKGSGFYNTDYGTKKRARERAADSNGKADKSDGKSSSGDSRSTPASSTSDGGAKKPDSGTKSSAA